MGRNTITITATNGVKVRTVASKIYFVVNAVAVTHEYVPYTDDAPGHWVELPEPRQEAAVLLRTDSASAARAKVRKHSRATVYRYSPSASPEVVPLSRDTIERLAHREQQAKAGR
jgi:hypothetical protein